MTPVDTKRLAALHDERHHYLRKRRLRGLTVTEERRLRGILDEIDAIEMAGRGDDVTACTGPTAFWCPACGDCTCHRDSDGDCTFDGSACPLHGLQSAHAVALKPDLFARLYATLPECGHSGCKRRATVRLVNRPTVLCDEHAEQLGDDEVGTWRTEPFPWADIVREQEQS